MTEDWLARWREGRIGWHEALGNAQLQSHWPERARGSRVLVPLCGKSGDLAWLAGQGCDVTGVELSEIAVTSFFADRNLACEREVQGDFIRYRAGAHPITLYCGNYFKFTKDVAPPCFDALYDRGALVALDEAMRPAYVAHTDTLLGDTALRFVVTLEYEQVRVDGPPYSVLEREILGYWPDLRRVAEHNDIDNCPPKFREAGLTVVREAAWLSP